MADAPAVINLNRLELQVIVLGLDMLKAFTRERGDAERYGDVDALRAKIIEAMRTLPDPQL